MTTKYNKSEIFTNAWVEFKKFNSSEFAIKNNRFITLAAALKNAWLNAKKALVNVVNDVAEYVEVVTVESVKALLNNVNADRWSQNSKMHLKDDAMSIVYKVAQLACGFASDIAETVLKFERCSDKQAYWIAKTAIENNIA